MQTFANAPFVIVRLAIFLFTTLASTVALADQPTEDLFRQALVADAQGDDSTRDRFLEESLLADTQFELSHWYRGEVLFDGQWKKVEAIQQLVANDPRWKEYQSRSAKSDSSLAAQTSLARWCRDQHLTYEAKWHWLNVLLQDPLNREAQGHLGMRTYQGRLLTDKQIVESKRTEKKAAADFKHYSKKFREWIRTALQGEAPEQIAVFKQFASVNESAAIPALMEAAFADTRNENLIRAKLDAASEDQFIQRLRESAVTSLSGIEVHQATLNLLQIAVEAEDAEIRTLAAEVLKYRDKTSYIPLLMAALAEPIELAIAVNVLPNGQVTVHEDLAETGPLAKIEHSRSSSYLTQYKRIVTRDVPGTRGKIRSVNISRIWSDRQRDFNNAANRVAIAQAQVADENAAREVRNDRIVSVLQIATGEDLGLDPKRWWNNWAQYNELETPEELPSFETTEYVDYSRSYVEEYAIGRTVSCFVGGTPVWTQAGPAAIESIQVGDMVLSQHPVTGELDYRPVTLTTVRKPSPTVRLGLGGETIIATRGHRFWVAGEGWQMAKFLKPNDQLWAVGGLSQLDIVEPHADAEAFNLEVGQFHTYFVGQSKVLVHDNRCPLPTAAILPGVESLP